MPSRLKSIFERFSTKIKKPVLRIFSDKGEKKNKKNEQTAIDRVICREKEIIKEAVILENVGGSVVEHIEQIEHVQYCIAEEERQVKEVKLEVEDDDPALMRWNEMKKRQQLRLQARAEWFLATA